MTPCRELREDSPGQVCLYNSRVARASSRLTSTSNTIPFSSRTCTHRCWNYTLIANLRPTLSFYRALASEYSSNNFIWLFVQGILQTFKITSLQRTLHQLTLISWRLQTISTTCLSLTLNQVFNQSHHNVTNIFMAPRHKYYKFTLSHPLGSPLVPCSCGCSSYGTQRHPEWMPQWWSSPPWEGADKISNPHVHKHWPTDKGKISEQTSTDRTWASPHHGDDVKCHEVEPAPVARHRSDSFL